MTESTKTPPSFLDDDLELDLDLFGEDDADAKPSRRVRRQKSYSPRRQRRTPHWQRIGMAVFAGLVIVTMIVLGVKAVLDARREAAFSNYMRVELQDVAERSATQGGDLQDLLAQPSGADRAQLIQRIEELGNRADKLVAEAEAIKPPDGMANAHESFVLAMQYRANGFDALQKAMTASLQTAAAPAAGGSSGEGSSAAASSGGDAATAVAEANKRFVASDVIYTDSFFANARQVLADKGVNGISVQKSEFVSDPEFTSVKSARMMLARLQTSAAGGARATGKGNAGKPPPLNDGKKHGTGVMSVKMAPSGKVLAAEGVNEIQGSDSLKFQVLVENQGEGQEVKIPVTVTLKGSGAPQELTGTLDSIDPGQQAFVTVPLSETPKFGETYTVTVDVGAVPGEKVTSNNSMKYSILFKL